MKRAAVVLLIRVPRVGDPLMLATTNRHFGGYSLPGGKLEPDDASARAAAIRELREETRVTVIHSDLTLLARGVNVIAGEECDVSVFFARACWGEPRDVEEGTRHAWMRWHDFLDRTPFRAFYDRHLPDGILHLRPSLVHGG